MAKLTAKQSLGLQVVFTRCTWWLAALKSLSYSEAHNLLAGSPHEAFGGAADLRQIARGRQALAVRVDPLVAARASNSKQ